MGSTSWRWIAVGIGLLTLGCYRSHRLPDEHDGAVVASPDLGVEPDLGPGPDLGLLRDPVVQVAAACPSGR